MAAAPQRVGRTGQRVVGGGRFRVSASTPANVLSRKGLASRAKPLQAVLDRLHQVHAALPTLCGPQASSGMRLGVMSQ